MRVVRDLFRLSWLTGEDGRIAFWKLAYITLMSIVGVVVWHLVDSPELVTALWPLVWLIALMLAGAVGIKGLQLWFQAARLRTNAVSDLSRIEQNRDQNLGIEPTP